MIPFHYVDTYEGLVQLVHFLSQSDAVAVDTEFVWQRTYFPQLGIIQLASSRDAVFIVDTVAITDPQPLKELLENPSIVKTFHDAHQDITIINRYIGGEVHNVFDTQRAAAFTGRPRTLSLEKLIREFTGVQLAKSETRTNWLQRPLAADQVDYALDDVRYLPEVRLMLMAEAEKYGNLAYQAQEMEAFDSIAPFDLNESIEKQFRKVAGRIAPRGRGRAYRLVKWQEQEARLRDIPREHLIKKEAITDLALAEAVTLEELAAAGFLNPKQLARYGETVAAVLADETDLPSRELVKSLQRPASDSNEMGILIQLFSAFCHSLAESKYIDPSLLGNKAELSEMVRYFARHRHFPQLSGWRRTVLAESAELFLSGKVAIHCTPLPQNDTETGVER